MFSGFLQAAAYKNLNGQSEILASLMRTAYLLCGTGVNGLAGWRWLFIIDAIITIPIAIFGFLFLPDSPWDAKPSFILSAADIDLARARMKAAGRAEAEPWSKAKAKRIFSSWHIYVFPLLYVIWVRSVFSRFSHYSTPTHLFVASQNNSFIQAPMGYWLKSFNKVPHPVPGKTYTVEQINLLPLPTTAIFVVAALVFAWVSDGPLKGRRWPLIPVGAIITVSADSSSRFLESSSLNIDPLFQIIIASLLIKLPLYGHDTAHFVLYYLIQLGSGCGPAILNWAAEVCGDDNEKRALVIALGNDFAYVVQAIAPNFVWKTTDFPKATKGLSWVIGLSALLILWTALTVYLCHRDERITQRKLDEEHDGTDSSEDSPKSASITDWQPPK
ncbi:MFS transporter, ACS family, pantothenate transporter, partial [Phenoliferia sp. Uapishka_3]